MLTRSSSAAQSSSANGKPLNERFRELRGAHAFLYRGNVVGNAPELDGLVFEIRDRKTRARVAVARLANGTGIQQVASRLLDTKGRKRVRLTRADLQDFEICIEIRKAPLVMRMAEECDFSRRIEKSIECLCGCEYIFIFILKRAMHQNDTVGGQGALRQSGEPGKIVRVQLGTGPVHRGFGNRIKIRGVHQPGDGFVMITADGLRTQFAKQRDDFVWIGSVPYDIAETYGDVPSPRCAIERGRESRRVCMEIAENKNPHSVHPQNVIEYR
jgi:hypothetical protein